MRMLIPFTLLLLAHSALSAAVLKGRVRDAETGEPLPGANVYLENADRGASTGLDGEFEIAGVAEGSHTLVASFIGYEELRLPVLVTAGAVDLLVELVPEVFRGQEIVVVADRAKLRETPVAFTDVPRAEMDRKLGSRDLPLILDDTPGVYATGQGGGAGDVRINVRGFDQRNVAVMINGVPVNDMENGWVYWSNFDGLGDATSSVQVQRGLGASNLAIASVGGTLNIITDVAGARRGFRIRQEAGSSAFYKTRIGFSSGLMNGRTAFSLGVTRKTGDGLADQTWTSAWSYFGALSFLASEKHKIDLFVAGAPQRHGQRLYKQSIATFDAEYARSLGIGVEDPQSRSVSYNPNWGRSPFSSYREYYNGRLHEARDSAVLMERENYYHKPQVNLNWYWTPGEKADPVQRLLLLPRQGGRHRAPWRQPRPAGRRQHRLATGRGRAQHPDRGGSGSRPGGCRRSGGKRNRRADRPPQLGEPPLLVRIPGDGGVPAQQHLQAGPGRGPAVLQGPALARAAQPARRRLLRLRVGRQRRDPGQAARRQGLLPQRRSHALGRRFRPARGTVREADRLFEHLGVDNGIPANRLLPPQGRRRVGPDRLGELQRLHPEGRRQLQPDPGGQPVRQRRLAVDGAEVRFRLPLRQQPLRPDVQREGRLLRGGGRLPRARPLHRKRQPLLHPLDGPLLAQEHLQRQARPELPVSAQRHRRAAQRDRARPKGAPPLHAGAARHGVAGGLGVAERRRRHLLAGGGSGSRGELPGVCRWAEGRRRGAENAGPERRAVSRARPLRLAGHQAVHGPLREVRPGQPHRPRRPQAVLATAGLQPRRPARELPAARRSLRRPAG